MRWFCILAAFLAIILQRITFGKIIAKFYGLWYNAFEKLKQRINKKLESRHGKEKRIKNKIKIALIAIAMVVLSLMIILIVQTIQLHRLEKQKASASHDLVQIEEDSKLADKKSRN